MLSGQVCFVTGGSKGIGRAFVEKLLQEDAKFVAFLDIDNPTGVEAEKNLIKRFGKNKTRFFHADVTDTETLKIIMTHIKDAQGSLDIVVNNAGTGVNEYTQKNPPWVDIKESAIEKALNINCISLTLATKYALQVMVKQPQGGTILNISSMGGIFSMPHCPVYSATKHYVVGLTRSLGLAYSKSNVRINCVCPGFVDTLLFRKGLYPIVLPKESEICSPQFVAENSLPLLTNKLYNGLVLYVSADRKPAFKKYVDPPAAPHRHPQLTLEFSNKLQTSKL